MATTKITVKDNGPLRIEGDMEFVDKNGTPYHLGGRSVISICGCGLSKKNLSVMGPIKEIISTKQLRLICPRWM